MLQTKNIGQKSDEEESSKERMARARLLQWKHDGQNGRKAKAAGAQNGAGIHALDGGENAKQTEAYVDAQPA